MILRVLDFGTRLVPYASALKLQEVLHAARKEGRIPDTLVLLQHPPTYTIGKRGQESDFKVPLSDLGKGRGEDKKGPPGEQPPQVFHVPRGGEVTFHGPGQLVAYPIINLRTVGRGARAFVEGLEDAVIGAVGRFRVEARGRVQGATGVWVGERKIAAIGVKISHGVSSHGLALNVHTDLSWFDSIVPCGLADKEVTSLEREIQRHLSTGTKGVGNRGRRGDQEGDPVIQMSSVRGILVEGSPSTVTVPPSSSPVHGSGRDLKGRPPSVMDVTPGTSGKNLAAPGLTGGVQGLYSDASSSFVESFVAGFGFETVATVDSSAQGLSCGSADGLDHDRGGYKMLGTIIEELENGSRA